MTRVQKELRPLLPPAVVGGDGRRVDIAGGRRVVNLRLDDLGQATQGDRSVMTVVTQSRWMRGQSEQPPLMAQTSHELRQAATLGGKGDASLS